MTGKRAWALGLVVAMTLCSAPEAAAWPVELMQALSRDARKLLPKSLAALMAERETEIFQAAMMFPPETSRALALDLSTGQLTPETIAVLDMRAKETTALFREKQVSEAIVKLGSLVRVPADLSDPVLSVGPHGYPVGVTREYYAFVNAHIGEIPVVLDNASALKMDRRRLPAYWQATLQRTRLDSPVIRTTLFANGRLISHRALDYRSPVFGVASLAYSRAVTAIAATWLAVWREVRGDLTRQPSPSPVVPTDAPPLPAAERVPPPPSPAPPLRAAGAQQ
ncbi:MAG TPA: hypothetical protein VFM29_02990 [Vicinamibacteria bacterium]|nr:hypothetical protein [Vicinamibacteria bacterium]